MKITTNFSTPAGRMAPYLAAVLLMLSALGVVTAVALYVSARQIAAEAPALEERLARYRSREIQKPADLLPFDKLAVLRTRVRELNELTSSFGQPLPLLISRLEKLIPEGVRLVTLQYRSRENETRLVAEGNNVELLTDFMKQLERSGYFSQVLLTRQAQRAEIAQRAVQFEIQLRGKS